jgi:hypothetical protein
MEAIAKATAPKGAQDLKFIAFSPPLFEANMAVIYAKNGPDVPLLRPFFARIKSIAAAACCFCPAQGYVSDFLQHADLLR